MVSYCLLSTLLCSLLIAAQSPTNTALSRRVGKLQATLISFTGGVLSLLVLMIFFGTGNLGAITTVHWWQILGGLYGAYGVCAATYTVPHIGVALTLTVNLLGQLLMGAVIDTFGLIGQEISPVSNGYFIGIGLLIIGIVFVYSGSVHQKKQKKINLKSLLPVLVALTSGIGAAIQSPTNAGLGMVIGKIEAAWISFTGGFLIMLVVTLISGKGHLHPMRGVGIHPWMLLGGLYGAANVFNSVASTPVLGVALLVSASMCGQLSGAVIVDNLGLFEASRTKADRFRIIGILMIAAGVGFITAARMK